MFNAGLLHLLHLSDPALPIGGFSHSAGLETYVVEGRIKNKQQAKEFATQQLSQNIFYTDAALASLAYDAARADELTDIIELDELCTAVKLPREIRQASNKLGTRLLKIFEEKVSCELVKQYCRSVKQQEASGHYCIAFGLLANALKLEKGASLTGFYYNAASAFTTNCVKLIPLGQQDGQDLLVELFPLIEELALKSLQPDKDLIGFCCSGFDIRSMQHEQLYSRLYMS